MNKAHKAKGEKRRRNTARRSSETRLRRRSALIFAAAVFLVIAVPLVLWIRLHDAVVSSAALAALLAMLALLVCIRRQHLRYDDDLLEDLALLTENIIGADSLEIFPANRDSLTSRFQNQIHKLSRILKRQNDLLSGEKEQIKALISDISHQIKTPVSSVRMFGELLQTPNITEDERQEYGELLRQSLDKLIFLTDSLIKMSRLESGIIRLKPAPADIRDVILAAVQQVRHSARAKQIELSVCDLGDIRPNGVECDPSWTTEALVNILDNAVKYTPSHGRVEISAREYPSYLCVKISDDGVGIPEEEQGRIFQRFYRGACSAGTEGIGIGLYLTKKILLEQNGYIRVASDDGGTDFFVFLKKRSGAEGVRPVKAD